MPYAVNDRGQIVGERDGRAFLCQNVRAGSLTTAAAINDAGQISGTGPYNGRTRGFLMAPVKRAPSVPASLILR